MPHLTAEVLSIGDEMTSGARLDTNAQWLSRRLGELGIEVRFHSTIGDRLVDNVRAFQIACERSDVVVCTGGLGPTRDDLTREALAELVDEPLVLCESSLQHIESLFARRKREMPARNRNQAMFPASAQEIFNPQGTAPGVDLAVPRDGQNDSRIFALPGVPAEMKTMFDQTVVPRLLSISDNPKNSIIRHEVMRFFGTGESDMEQQLGDMIRRDREPRVGITVSAATISLRITSMGSSEQECDDRIQATRQEILDRVGEYHFGDGDEYEQHHAVEESLKQNGHSLLVIELGFAAPLGDWFAQLGETPAYRGGLSLANTEDLCRLSGQPDAQSAIQEWMKRFDATHVLMIDRYPTLESNDEHPLPASRVELHVARAGEKVRRHAVTLGGHPSILQARIAKAGLAWLRQCLREKR